MLAIVELVNAYANSYLESDVFELFCSDLLTFWKYPREAETSTSQEICVNIMSHWEAPCWFDRVIIIRYVNGRFPYLNIWASPDKQHAWSHAYVSVR